MGIRPLPQRVVKRFRLASARSASGEGIFPRLEGRSGEWDVLKASGGGSWSMKYRLGEA